jgi:hypothetical protein
MEIIKQLARFQAELFNTSFTQIGSLYEEPGKSGFTVGKSAPSVQIERAKINRGPWSTPREEMQDLLTEQLAEIRDAPEEIRSARHNNGCDDKTFRIDEFEKLYAALLRVVERLPLFDMSVRSYSILHPDLNPHNIMVGYDDPSCIVGIIDWEGTRIQPRASF